VTAIRLSPQMREGLDRAAAPDTPSRSALIRRIVAQWLEERGLHEETDLEDADGRDTPA